MTATKHYDLTPQEEAARQRVCLALDVQTLSEALGLVTELSDLVGTFKVGSVLHRATVNEGVNIVWEIHDRGGSTFLDLKYHDTPNTVYKSGIGSAVPGVYMFNIHIAGGEAMCRKAVEGAYEGARIRGIARPKVIGVTVLTSLSDEDLAAQHLSITIDELIKVRTELARKWGLDGVVCPANKAGKMERLFGSDLLYVTPGIEWKGKKGEGQKQLYTPDLAVRDCSNSILVIGSAITAASDKRATAYEILQAMAKEL